MQRSGAVKSSLFDRHEGINEVHHQDNADLLPYRTGKKVLASSSHSPTDLGTSERSEEETLNFSFCPKMKFLNDDAIAEWETSLFWSGMADGRWVLVKDPRRFICQLVVVGWGREVRGSQSFWIQFSPCNANRRCDQIQMSLGYVSSVPCNGVRGF